MSKIERLIEELCPDGVEYKKLGEVILSLNTGLNPRKFFKLNTEDARNYYVTIREIQNNSICFTEKTDRINDEAMILCNKRSNLEIGDILFSGTGTIGETAIINKTPLNWNIKEGVYAIKSNKEYLEPKFLMYLLKGREVRQIYMKKVVGGTVKSIPMKELRQLEIPVPPLPIQEEIVRILDSFTEKTNELKAQLEEELEARNKQYEWYRNAIFNQKYSNRNFVLEEIATIKARIGWQGLTKKEYLSKGYALLVTGIDFRNGLIDFNNCYYVTQERYEQDKNIQLKENDILVTKDGTLGKMAYIYNLPQEATLNSGIFVIRIKNKNDILPRYLYHYLNSGKLMSFAKSKLTGGTIKHLNQNVVVKTPITLPPLEEQHRIVDILDRFDKLCNDITEGLPAEIDARQKQYEYYRDKLLTFKKKEIINNG